MRMVLPWRRWAAAVDMVRAVVVVMLGGVGDGERDAGVKMRVVGRRGMCGLGGDPDRVVRVRVRAVILLLVSAVAVVRVARENMAEDNSRSRGGSGGGNKR